MTLDILYQDEFLVAVDKPAGMLVHRTKMAARERVVAMQTLRNQLDKQVYTIHRLDKGTSGVLLFALDATSARLLSELFQSRSITKTYRAIVRGWIHEPGIIDHALKERLDKTTDGKARKDKPAQEATTKYSVISRTEIDTPVGRYETARYSLLDIRPLTGRKHQIRRHFKHIFHPILGDRKYGDRDHNHFLRETLYADRMMLAATGIQFMHPVTGVPIGIEVSSGFPNSILRHFSNSGLLDSTKSLS